jgi:hypothetical protein
MPTSLAPALTPADRVLLTSIHSLRSADPSGSLGIRKLVSLLSASNPLLADVDSKRVRDVLAVDAALKQEAEDQEREVERGLRELELEDAKERERRDVLKRREEGEKRFVEAQARAKAARRVRQTEKEWGEGKKQGLGKVKLAGELDEIEVRLRRRMNDGSVALKEQRRMHETAMKEGKPFGGGYYALLQEDEEVYNYDKVIWVAINEDSTTVTMLGARARLAMVQKADGSSLV